MLESANPKLQPGNLQPADPTQQSGAALTTPDEPFYIVGIGASAGGLEALRSLIPTFSDNPKLCYVIAQHMDPNHNSMLATILERDTPLPVQELRPEEVLQSARIYIIPPGKDALLNGDRIHLKPATTSGPKPSIDRFFESLGKQRGKNSIGVILSGTGSDGARGLYHIKAEGGITVAQQENSAKFSSMPQAAIATGHVDFILTPEQIGELLPGLVSLPRKLPESAADTDQDEYQHLFRLLLQHTGTDFSNYKQTTVTRRIERRMAVNRLTQLDAYMALLEQHPNELERLHDDLLISVTNFFRDPDAYETLKQYLPHLLSQAEEDTELRIWVAGCATGEEAYSMAILLNEFLRVKGSRYRLQIFATDLDKAALAQARHGVYAKSSVTELDPTLLAKYFDPTGDSYRVKQSLRERVLFAHHDLSRDPPFSHLDLITCRNLLIYFKAALQKQVFQTFHYALKTNGLLFLGKSESIGTAQHLFSPLSSSAKIYQRQASPQTQTPYFLSLGRQPGQSERRPAGPAMASRSNLESLHHALVQFYAPNCLLLNEQQEITYLHGELEGFLTLPNGRAGLHVMDLIRDELKQDLRGMLYRARREKIPVRSRKIPLVQGQKTLLVTLGTHYLGPTANSLDRYIVVFQEHGHLPEHEIAIGPGSEDAPPFDQLEALQRELTDTRQNLQTTIEELETTNEELQSTFEEAQSTNEELITSTEELQTSNEELQSANEELRTVNEELNAKHAQLEAANRKLLEMNQQLAHEIERRKTAQEQLALERHKLKAIIDAEPAWVNICDAQGVIKELNPQGLEIMEAERPEELIGRSLKEFISPEYRDAALQCLAASHDGVPKRTQVEVTTLRNHRRWLELNTVLLPKLEGDASLALMSIITDQTERVMAESRAKDRLYELSKVMRLNTLGEMASGLAHELNQPLAAISNYISGCERRLVNDSCDKDEILKVLRISAQQAQTAGDIVNHIRAFLGKGDAPRQAVDLDAAINEAISLTQVVGDYQAIRFTCDIAKNLPQVLADAVQIEQVLVNLMKNAIEAMLALETPVPELIIRAHCSSSRCVEVSVEDFGGGLPEGLEEEIFKSFFTTKTTGMGMGLSISRTIIESHGSKLECQNLPGIGMIFRFKLPVYEVTAE